MIVVDASAVLEVLLQTERAAAVEEHLFGGAMLQAPHLLDLEVVRALRRYQALEELSPDRARAALDLFLDLEIERYPHEVFLRRVWDLGEAVSPSDALYLALAEVLDAPLLTTDPRLTELAGHEARVQLVGAPANTASQFDFDFGFLAV